MDSGSDSGGLESDGPSSQEATSSLGDPSSYSAPWDYGQPLRYGDMAQPTPSPPHSAYSVQGGYSAPLAYGSSGYDITASYAPDYGSGTYSSAGSLGPASMGLAMTCPR